MEIQQNEKDKKSKTYLMILIGALFALNIGIGVNLFLSNKKNKEQAVNIEGLNKDKDKLQKEIQGLEIEIETIRAENQGLNDQLNEKDQEITKKINQIKVLLSKGKLSDAEFKKAKAEILSLKSEIEAYKQKVAELTKQNEELTAQNTDLTQNLTAEQIRSAEKDRAIEQRDKKINKAKILHASGIVVSGVRERKLFGKKEVVTDKASKVEEIKVKFSLDQNVVADAGDKDIFVKIIGPDGAPITGKMQTTKVDGTETLYTEKKTVDYKNERLDDVVYCKKQGSYTKGEYTVEIFAEGFRIGSSKFSLK